MDLEIDRDLVEYVIAPLVSAQLFLIILVYFIIVRKRISAYYKLYITFIVTYIIFLIGRIGWVLNNEILANIILFVRFGLLMGLGIPSLLVAAAKQSGVQNTKSISIVSYTLGVVLSIAYILFFDADTSNLFYLYEWLARININNPMIWAHNTQLAGALIQLVLPFSWLILIGIHNKKEPKHLAFLLGTLLFGVALLMGLCFKPQNFGLFYIGSIPTGIIWFWAVFNDIRDMKGKVALVKDELQMIVRLGIGTKTEDFNNLLRNLEEISYKNSDVYKMRIREILNMLTDTTIEAGGDTQTLIKRNTERANAIETSTDTNEIRTILYNEAIELSEIIKQIPSQNEIAVRKVIEYLKTHFTEDLSADDISNIAGLSKAHLMREFKQLTGQTLNQLQTSLRIEESKKLLSKKTVTETAYSIGYNNPNYFSTVFKKQTGLSPIAYQESLKNNQ